MVRRRQRGLSAPPGTRVDTIGDDEILTQYGMEAPANDPQPTFRSRPRTPKEKDVSLLRGRLSKRAAAEAVRKRGEAKADRVRYGLAGDLRAAGFAVDHTPSAGNPGHVSVTLPGSTGEWNDLVQAAFEQVFNR